MGSEVFLGEPPANIKEWMKNNFRPVKTFVKYTAASGVQPWSGLVEGTLGRDSIPNIDYAEEVCVGSAVTQLGSGTFQSKTALKSVAIPDTVKSIPATCFNGCTGLSAFEIPDQISSIGQYAFDACLNLKRVKIDPNRSRLADVGPYAFCNCSSLCKFGDGEEDEFVLPAALTSVQSYAFSKTGIWVINGADGLSSVAFGGHVFENCENLEHVDCWPSDVVPDYAFYGCSDLGFSSRFREIVSVGERAFSYTSIGYDQDIYMDNVSSIGEYGLANCTTVDGEYYHNFMRLDSAVSIGHNALMNNGAPYDTRLQTYYMTSLTVAQVAANARDWGIGYGSNAQYDYYYYKVRVICKDGEVVINDDIGS